MPHRAVVNAIGAAIAHASGEVDQGFSGCSREVAIDQATALSRQRAIGADDATLNETDIEDVPLAYLPGDARRVSVRVVGDVRPASHDAGAD